MNEEQIIEYLENQDNSVNWNYSTLWAVKGLLDLYQKEKEKNKELEKKIEEYRIGWCNEGEKSEKLYEEIKKLQELLEERN